MQHSRHLTLSLFAACAFLPAAGLFAQAPAAPAAPAATPSVSATATTAAAPEPGRREGKRERLAALTPEERQKLKAAHQAALQDPAVKAAEATKTTDRRGYHKAMRDAMLKADPSVAPILEKMRGERRGHGAL